MNLHCQALQRRLGGASILGSGLFVGPGTSHDVDVYMCLCIYIYMHTCKWTIVNYVDMHVVFMMVDHHCKHHPDVVGW